jgi:hypothetical protein
MMAYQGGDFKEWGVAVYCCSENSYAAYSSDVNVTLSPKDSSRLIRYWAGRSHREQRQYDNIHARELCP